MEKFILTRELGRLVKWLRILGFDTVYFTAKNISSLVITALREDRIILTRNLRLNPAVGTKMLKVKDDFVVKQLKQIIQDVDLKLAEKQLFTRCIICNSELKSIAKEKVENKVPEYVFKTQEEFSWCPACDKIYWSGTHWGNVKDTLREIGALN
ncbi:MAG: Mut7-C RNAse domain-containing protein [Candidatus Omnitrophota bacterium]|nr:Mut7-C RNAse domain-containing protein [Candidatus Omnitrophota bacterium]